MTRGARAPSTSGSRHGRAPGTLLAGLAFLLLVGCSDVQRIVGLKPTEPAELALHLSQLALSAGEQVRLNAVILNADGDQISHEVAWSSTNPTLGLVDSTGWVTALADSGEFHVEARAGELTERARVQLRPTSACSYDPSGSPYVPQIADVQVLQTTEVGRLGVPATTGKPTLVRVSLTVDAETPVAAPAVVTVHLLRGGTLLALIEAAGPACLPNTASINSFNHTFNAELPALSSAGEYALYATATVRAHDGSNVELRFPQEGTTPMRVVKPPLFDVTFVPVQVVGRHQIEEVIGSDLDEAVSTMRSLFPMDEIATSIREPIVFTPSDAMDHPLEALRDLRLLDGSTSYYHGLVGFDLDDDGVASGMGYFATPVAWSRLVPPEGPSGTDRHYVPGLLVAHELGHNFDLNHADCGDAAGASPNQPYVGARTNGHGYNWLGLEPFGPLVPADALDVMSYCGPKWMSDKNYRRILSFRTIEARQSSLNMATTSRTQVLLVSGRVSGGLVTLSPGFSFEGVPQPPAPGEWTWRLVSAAGGVLLSSTFQPAQVSDGPGSGEQGFGFTISVTEAVLAAAVKAQVLDATGAVVAEATTGSVGLQQAGPNDVELVRHPDGRVVATWDVSRWPSVVARDAETQRVVALGGAGTLQLPSTGADLYEFLLSDGVRSVSVRVPLSR